MTHYDKYRQRTADSERALRYNSGKPKYSIIGLDTLEQCARVLEFGAAKYGRNNWRKGLPITEILDSMLRHIAALSSGELIDQESGLPHIGHIQANAMFLGNVNNTMDIEEKQPKQVELALKAMGKDGETVTGLCAPS
jgi:hypothetical protein